MDAKVTNNRDRTDERTHHEAKNDLCYSSRYLLLQCRFFSRMGGVFDFVSLFSGSAAFIGLITSSALVTGVSGAFVSASTVLSFVIKPAGKAIQCQIARNEILKLLRKADTLSLEELDRKASKVACMETPHIESLRFPAYNDTMLEIGRNSYVVPLTRWQRFMHHLA